MKALNRNSRSWRVNWPVGRAAPKVGDVVHRFTPTNQDAGFYKVTSVTVINHRKPLPPGYDIAYRVGYIYLGDTMRLYDWYLHDHARPAKRDRGLKFMA